MTEFIEFPLGQADIQSNRTDASTINYLKIPIYNVYMMFNKKYLSIEGAIKEKTVVILQKLSTWLESHKVLENLLVNMSSREITFTSKLQHATINVTLY